ncbi:hypothetical protein Agabi119p4_2895 [Agaricus bisporus var. burnettii]|uniref:Uncharacterized protein n=1 Tax=Agaricus bisporus var. burnettii TaxID=192524 RepID=A0A8H7KID8_AGABI|nr:hypothetical protein Agabi119p4_2895 [Agaricus bisporus var. burnettii]
MLLASSYSPSNLEYYESFEWHRKVVMSSPPSSKKPRIGSKSLSGASTSHEFAVPPPHHDHTSLGSTTPLTRDRDDEFKKTMKANKCFFAEEPVVDPMLTKMQNSMKLSTTVNDEGFRKWIFQFSGVSITFPEDVLSADDPYNLTHMKYVFLVEWRQHILASKARRSELDLRSGIDTLMRQAFDSKYIKRTPQVIASYRTEQELYVPVISSNRAKTDAVVWLPIPSPLNSFFQMLDNNHVFSAEASGEHDLLATSIFEARLQDEAIAVRQFFRIYGAVLFGSELTLYSSEWDGDVISIRPTTIVFDLSQFQNFLTLFVFLCQLADSIVGQIEEMRSESKKNEDSLRKRLATATQNQWRSSIPLSSRFVEGEMDDSLEEGTSEGLDDENDDIRDDDPKLLHPPLRKIYVKNVQASDKDIQRWANQSAQEPTNCPAEIS